MLREAPDRPYRADALDIDSIEALGEAIVENEALLSVVSHRSLVMIADFDRMRGWELAGYPSCAHWLSARCRTELSSAREKVRAARALAGLPLTSAAMARGQLSYCQVRALTRAAEADNEAELLALAGGIERASARADDPRLEEGQPSGRGGAGPGRLRVAHHRHLSGR